MCTHAQLLSFCTEIECVFVSTHAILRLHMAKDISELGTARSLIQLMHAAFEFEYVAVRSSFMIGLLAFLAAQSLHVRCALREHKEAETARAEPLISSAENSTTAEICANAATS